jgi:hypothetical protein
VSKGLKNRGLRLDGFLVGSGEIGAIPMEWMIEWVVGYGPIVFAGVMVGGWLRDREERRKAPVTKTGARVE